MTGCGGEFVGPQPEVALTATDSLGVQLLAAERVQTMRWSATLGSIVYETEIPGVPPCLYCPSLTSVELRLADPVAGTVTDPFVDVRLKRWQLSSTGFECFVMGDSPWSSTALRRFDLRRPGLPGVLEGLCADAILSPGDSLIAWRQQGDPQGYGLPHPLDSVRVFRRGHPAAAVDGGRGRPLEFSPDSRQLIVERALANDYAKSLWLVDTTTLDSIALPAPGSGFTRLAIDWDGSNPRIYYSAALPSRIVEYLPLTGVQNTILELPFAAADGVSALNDPAIGGPMAFSAFRWENARRKSAIWSWEPSTREMRMVAEGYFSVGGGDFLGDDATLAAAIDGKLYLIPLPMR